MIQWILRTAFLCTVRLPIQDVMLRGTDSQTRADILISHGTRMRGCCQPWIDVDGLGWPSCQESPWSSGNGPAKSDSIEHVGRPTHPEKVADWIEVLRIAPRLGMDVLLLNIRTWRATS